VRAVRARPDGTIVSAAPRIPVVTLVLAASLAACTSGTGSTRAPIEGAHDLALVGDLLFVTSTDENELHVIDLTEETPDFVRAPNPLHALSIPVVDRPVALARDVTWVNGQEIGGSYVYALSANSRDISVVGAGSLMQMSKLTLDPGRTFTAAAAQGASDGPSTLFVATYDGSVGRIQRVTVPAPSTIPADPPLALALEPAAVVELPCAVVTSLLVLPEDKLAWSSRRSGQASFNPTGCSSPTPVFLAGFIDAAGVRTELRFPFPVRKLFTHAKFTDSTPVPPVEHPAADRIFGILDESSCTEGDECRGIVAVVGPKGVLVERPGEDCGDVVGKVACDFSGSRMLRIRSTGELVMGAAVLADGSPVLPASAASRPTDLIGVYTTSDGRMVFFDAENLRHFDIDAAAPRPGVFGLRAPDGGVLPATAGPVADTVTLTDGAARDEVINFTYLGDLPGFSKIAAPSALAEIPVTANPAGIVQDGSDGGARDFVYVEGGVGCSGAAKVTSFVAGTDGGFTVILDSAIGGQNCTVSIRPDETAPEPWVVVGTSSGYLGRIAPSPEAGVLRELPPDEPRRRALFFNRPADFNPANPVPPLLKLAFLDPPSLPAIGARQPGYRVEMTTASGFRVAEVSMVGATVAGPPVLRPGSEEDELWVPVFLDPVTISSARFASGVYRFQVESVVAGSDARGLLLR
jgi:hypothetical protein